MDHGIASKLVTGSIFHRAKICVRRGRLTANSVVYNYDDSVTGGVQEMFRAPATVARGRGGGVT